MNLSEYHRAHGLSMYTSAARACLPEGRSLVCWPSRGLCLIAQGPTVDASWEAAPFLDLPNAAGMNPAAYTRQCVAAEKRWVQAQAAGQGYSLRLKDIEI